MVPWRETSISLHLSICGGTTFNFEPMTALKVKVDDVELPAIDNFMLAIEKDEFCDQLKQPVEMANFFVFGKMYFSWRRPLLSGP